jgi:hypothetical protein
MSITGALMDMLRSWFKGPAAPHPRGGASAAADHEPREIERRRDLELRILMLTWM